VLAHECPRASPLTCCKNIFVAEDPPPDSWLPLLKEAAQLLHETIAEAAYTVGTTLAGRPPRPPQLSCPTVESAPPVDKTAHKVGTTLAGRPLPHLPLPFPTADVSAAPSNLHPRLCA